MSGPPVGFGESGWEYRPKFSERKEGRTGTQLAHNDAFPCAEAGAGMDRERRSERV